MIYLPGDARANPTGREIIGHGTKSWWTMGRKAFAARSASDTSSPRASNSNSKTTGLLRQISRFHGTGSAPSLPTSFQESEVSEGIEKRHSLNDLAIPQGRTSDNSRRHFHDTCLEGTRTIVLAEIRRWAEDTNSRPIFALVDQAGTGKSTIAATIAKEWNDADRICADFYFGKSTGTTADNLIITLAHDVDSEEFDPCAPELAQPISTQLERLVVDPLKARRARVKRELQAVQAALQQMREGNALMNQAAEMEPPERRRSTTSTLAATIQNIEELEKELTSTLGRPPILLIDALDECSSPDRMAVLGALLALASQDSPCKFFITCRPESDLVVKLEEVHELICSLEHSLLSRAYQPDNDITLYTNAHLRHILDESQIHRFVVRCRGLFMWASVAQEYITSTSRGTPVRYRYEEIMNTLPRDLPIIGFYDTILQRALMRCAENEKGLKMVLQVIATSREWITLQIIEDIMSVSHNPNHQSVIRIVSNLRSALLFDPNGRPQIVIHPTFMEYLRSGLLQDPLNFSVEEGHALMARGCFHMLTARVRLEQASFIHSYVAEGSTTHQPLEETTPALRYALKYYLLHSIHAWGVSFVELTDQLLLFFKSYLLYWLEYASAANQLDIAKKRVDALGNCTGRRHKRIAQWCDETVEIIKLIQDNIDLPRDCLGQPGSSLIPTTGLIYECYGKRAEYSITSIIDAAKTGPGSEANDRSDISRGFSLMTLPNAGVSLS